MASFHLLLLPGTFYRTLTRQAAEWWWCWGEGRIMGFLALYLLHMRRKSLHLTQRGDCSAMVPRFTQQHVQQNQQPCRSVHLKGSETFALHYVADWPFGRQPTKTIQLNSVYLQRLTFRTDTNNGFI